MRGRTRGSFIDLQFIYKKMRELRSSDQLGPVRGINGCNGATAESFS